MRREARGEEDEAAQGGMRGDADGNARADASRSSQGPRAGASPPSAPPGCTDPPRSRPPPPVPPAVPHRTLRSLSCRVMSVRLARVSSRWLMGCRRTLRSTVRLAIRASEILAGVLVTLTCHQPAAAARVG